MPSAWSLTLHPSPSTRKRCVAAMSGVPITRWPSRRGGRGPWLTALAFVAANGGAWPVVDHRCRARLCERLGDGDAEPNVADGVDSSQAAAAAFDGDTEVSEPAADVVEVALVRGADLHAEQLPVRRLLDDDLCAAIGARHPAVAIGGQAHLGVEAGQLIGSRTPTRIASRRCRLMVRRTGCARSR